MCQIAALSPEEGKGGKIWIPPSNRCGKFHILNPGEFGADTAELIQMLKKGHHGVKLDDQSWGRLYAWIDLNAPCHGTWRETVGIERMATDHARRFELRKLYGGSTDDPETIREDARATFKQAEEAAGRFAGKTPPARSPRPQYASGSIAKITHAPRYISLGDGVRLKMVYIPAGEFVMGDPDGLSDEQPASLVKIEKPFWMRSRTICGGWKNASAMNAARAHMLLNRS